MFFEKPRLKTGKMMYRLVLKDKSDNGKRKNIRVDICGPVYADRNLARLGYRLVHEKLITCSGINALEHMISEFCENGKRGLSWPVIRLEKLDAGYDVKLYSR
jgi:hypothetical protein